MSELHDARTLTVPTGMRLRHGTAAAGGDQSSHCHIQALRHSGVAEFTLVL